MTQVSLRQGTPVDIGPMYELDLLCFDAPFRFDLRSMRRYATHPEAIVLIAEADGAMRGFIVISPSRRRALHSAYVTTLDVHPDFRRGGIARALIAEAERRAAETGAVSIHLHVFAGNVAAVRFYESVGYEQAMFTEDFYAPGLHAAMLIKSI